VGASDSVGFGDGEPVGLDRCLFAPVHDEAASASTASPAAVILRRRLTLLLTPKPANGFPGRTNVALVARLIDSPSIVEAAGTPSKTIREHVGRVNTGDGAVSIAHMTSPPGWSEPWQTPEFDEWTLVFSGSVLVEHDDGTFTALAGQTVHAPAGQRVRYSTPDGADYVAVCLPAFSPDTVHRDD
jgi:quercetin dioxygenase-like cupin family protein